MRLLFRIVDHDPPTADDFRSLADLGFERITKWVREYERGVSVYDDFDHVVSLMRTGRLAHGPFVSTLAIPADANIEIAKTFRDPHHYTIYLIASITAEMLASLVIEAVMVVV